MTPERFDLRYAYPCVESMFDRGCITIGEQRQILQYVFSDKTPSRQMLMDCFPNVYQEKCVLAEKTSSVVWDISLSKLYWRQHHKGLSPVMRMCMYKTFGHFAEVHPFVDREANSMLAMNIYGLELNAGDTIYIHQRCIIEKEEE